MRAGAQRFRKAPGGRPALDIDFEKNYRKVQSLAQHVS